MSDPNSPPPSLPPQGPAPKKGMSTGCIIALCVVPILGLILFALIAAVAVPTYNGITQRAKQMKQVSNAKVAVLAIKMYAIDNEDKTPTDMQELVDGGYLAVPLTNPDGSSVPVRIHPDPGTDLATLNPSSVLVSIETEDGAVAVGYVDGSAKVMQGEAPSGP